MFNIKKLFLKLKINISSIIFYYKKRIFIKKLANTTLENMKKISRKKLEKKSDLPIHLAIGHENLSSVVSLVKNQYDNFVLTHRNIHFNFALSDQSDYEKIINETLLEKESINAGNYGCMTMRNSRKGIIYTSSILANNISVGLGIASTNFKNGVTWIQTGDGAIEEGAFYEGMVFAKSRNLPTIIIIENNNWSLGSSIKERRNDINIKLLANSIGIGYQEIKNVNSIYEISTKIFKAREEAKFNTQIIEVQLKTLGGKMTKERGYQSYHCGPITLYD